jgi:hypothetical protein
MKGKKIVFIAFTVDNTITALDFIKTTGFKYDVVPDFQSLQKKFYSPGGYPTNMEVDKNGIVRQVFCGLPIDESAKKHAYDLIKPTIDKYLNN